VCSYAGLNHADKSARKQSKSKTAAATLFLLILVPVLTRAQSIGASAKTEIETGAATQAAAALANSKLAAKERLHAEQIYYQAVRDHPESAPAHNALAAFLWNNGKPEAALAHWQVAQRLDPANAEAANSLGEVYLRLGRVADAAEQFLRAVRSKPANPVYHFDLANVEFLLRHDLAAAWKIDSAEVLQRALAEFREASRLAPTDSEYARAYAETFYGMPDPDWKEALAAWQHYLELSTYRDFAYSQLARVSLKRRNKADALFYLGKISDPAFSGLKEKLRKQADAL
jgi:Flp pilus assembly protein TadD